MFSAIFTAIIRVVAVVGLFFQGAAWGSHGTDKHPKLRRIAIVLSVVLGVGSLIVGIFTLSPFYILVGVVGLLLTIRDIHETKTLLQKIRGEASAKDALEFLSFQTSATAS